MKYSKLLSISIILIFTFFSCSDDNQKSNEIRLRLSNVSSFDYKNIKVNTTTGIVSFDNINSGENTEYKIFERAYRYGFVELEIDGATYTIQPFDYVGETQLGSGNYTYEIGANESQEQYGKLSLNFVED